MGCVCVCGEGEPEREKALRMGVRTCCCKALLRKQATTVQRWYYDVVHNMAVSIDAQRDTVAAEQRLGTQAVASHTPRRRGVRQRRRRRDMVGIAGGERIQCAARHNRLVAAAQQQHRVRRASTHVAHSVGGSGQLTRRKQVGGAAHGCRMCGAGLVDGVAGQGAVSGAAPAPGTTGGGERDRMIRTGGNVAHRRAIRHSTYRRQQRAVGACQ